jgi:hypothetical protein
MGNYDMSMADALRGTTLVVNLKGVRRFKIRLRLAMFLMKAAARLMKVGIQFEGESEWETPPTD